MTKKSDQTKAFIIEQVAPIFNKKGYAATSMTDICSATKLTKGAIYGNFDNKEELSLLAFTHNVKKVVGKIAEELTPFKRADKKLFALSNFYRKYYDYTIAFGGCPILNVGIDSNHQNPALLKEVKRIIQKLEGNIAKIIEQGIQEGTFDPDLNASEYASSIFSMIEGSIFMAITMNNQAYILNMMDILDQSIHSKTIEQPSKKKQYVTQI